MDTLRRSLEKVGLGAYEAQIYSTLVEHSPAGASFIAKKCGLSRSSVYTTLQSLAGKGLVGTTYKNEVKQFIAEGHTALMDLVRREERQAEERVRLAAELEDQLTLVARPDAHVPKIVYFEGQQGLKRIYSAMLREARKDVTMLILRDEFIWRPAWKFVFERDWHQRVKRIKAEKNLRTMLLVNDSAEEKEHHRRRLHTETRFLPKRHGLRSFALYVLEDTVAILSMENNNLVGVKMVNQHLAANFATMFATLWQASTP